MENTNLIEQLRVYPIDFEQEDSNNVKLAISFWQRVNISYLEKLFDLGFTVEQLRGIIYGINAIQKLKADMEFSYNGIIRMRDDYPNKTLQSIISNAQIGVYESGLKYPKVGYNVIQSVFEKYGISLTPITINTTRLSIKGIEKEVTLTLFTSHEIIILYLQDEFDHKNNIEAVNGGYLGIISGDRDLLPSLLIDLFDNHDCYVKDLDLYYNGLSYGYEFLKDKNIITLQNGEFKINTMENNSAEPIVENIETTIEPNETENNTKEFSILSDTLKILFSAENKNSVWEKQVALNAGKMQLLVEKEPSLFPLYVTEMLAVPKKQRASINPYDKQTWKTDTVTNWLQAEGKNLLDFMPIREYDLPKYKPFETTHEDNTFMAIHDTFVSKEDGLRIALYGTNFSIDGITSTDANKLLFTPFRGNKYEGEPKIFCHTQKCFEKENEVVKAKYPDYKAILPNLYGSKYLLNTFAIYNFLKNVSELGLLSNIYSVGLTYYNKIVEKNDLIEFRAHLLLESIASLVKLGHTELEIGINLPNQGAIIYPAKKLTEALKLQEDFALVMPIAINLQHHELNYELETNCVTCGESTIKYCFDLVATKEKKRLEHANKLEAELADTKNKLAQTTSVLTGVIEADKAKAEAEQQAIIEAEERAEANRIAAETEAEAERARYDEMGTERLRLDEEQRIADEIEAQRIAAMTSQDYQNLIDEVSPMLDLVDEAQKADWKEYIDSLTTLMELKAEEEKVAKEAERQKQELILKGQTITYSPDENTYVEELNGSKIVNIKKGKHKGHYVITKAGAILNDKGEVNDDKTKAFVLAKIINRNGYNVFVTPTGVGLKPHVWTEGGKFATKEAAEFQAKQMRKMKDIYAKVEVIDAPDETQGAIAEELKHIRTPKKEWKISFEKYEPYEHKVVTVEAHSRKGAIRIARGKNNLWDGWEVLMINTGEPIEFAKGGVIGIDFQSKFKDRDLIENSITEHVADMVEQGYTSGELSGEEPNYTGWWSVSIEEDDNDEDIRNKEVAKNIRNGNTSGYYPTYTFKANVWKADKMEEGGNIKGKKIGFKQMDYKRLVEDRDSDYPFYASKHGNYWIIKKESTDNEVAKWYPSKNELLVSSDTDLKNWLKSHSYEHGYAEGGTIEDRANSLLQKLKEQGYTDRLITYQGQKVRERIQANKGADKGSYSRYYLAPNGDRSTAIKQNAYLEESEVLKLYKDSLKEKSEGEYKEGGEIESYKEEAYTIGRQARKNDDPRTPAQNKEIMALLKKANFPVGGGSDEIMKSFDKGYYDENEVEMQKQFPEMYKKKAEGGELENELTPEELKTFKALVRLGDSEELAYQTVINQRPTEAKKKLAKGFYRHGYEYKDGGSVWTSQQKEQMQKLDADFEKHLSDNNINPNSKEASTHWRNGGFQKRMGEIFGKQYHEGGGVNDNTFTYMMLGRLQSDNDYYLGNGNRDEKSLWAGNVDDQIKEMKKLWNQLPEDKKPEWLSMEEILDYEKKMKEQYAKGGNIDVLTKNKNDAEARMEAIAKELGGHDKPYISGMPLTWIYKADNDERKHVPEKYHEELDKLSEDIHKWEAYMNGEKYAKGGGIDEHYVQVNDLYIDKKTFTVITRENVKKYQGTSLEDATNWANNQYAKGGKVGNMHIYVSEIAVQTGLTQNAVINYILENNLTEPDVLKIVFGLGTRKILPIDMATAVSGTKDNAYSKKIITFTKSKDVFKKMAQGGAVDDKEESEKKDYHKCGKGTKIQSLVFDKATFDRSSAKKWAKENNFLHNKSDITENKVRLRQVSPTLFKRKSFKTIELTTGVQAVIGCPKKP